MVGNLHVRKLDDDLIARLKRRAARHGRSIEAEHREILRQALMGEVELSFDELAAELRKLTAKANPVGGAPSRRTQEAVRVDVGIAVTG